MFTSFHLVAVSLWPLLCSFVVWSLLVYAMFWWYYKVSFFFMLCFFFLVFLMVLWWLDVNLENLIGFHSSNVSSGFRLGMILFIISECFFFFSFFWGYFHKCWSPSVAMKKWPPFGFSSLVVDPFSLPLLNTILLLSSGVSITYCHHSLLSSKSMFIISAGFLITLFLGLVFEFMQAGEYTYGYFSINSSVYGTTFYLLTGFHGMHVLVGMSMIFFCFIRFLGLGLSSSVHVNFEVSAWYWHFVDVVWLFLFFFVYWYGFFI